MMDDFSDVYWFPFILGCGVSVIANAFTFYNVNTLLFVPNVTIWLAKLDSAFTMVCSMVSLVSLSLISEGLCGGVVWCSIFWSSMYVPVSLGTAITTLISYIRLYTTKRALVCSHSKPISLASGSGMYMIVATFIALLPLIIHFLDGQRLIKFIMVCSGSFEKNVAIHWASFPTLTAPIIFQLIASIWINIELIKVIRENSFPFSNMDRNKNLLTATPVRSTVWFTGSLITLVLFSLATYLMVLTRVFVLTLIGGTLLILNIVRGPLTLVMTFAHRSNLQEIAVHSESREQRRQVLRRDRIL